MPTSSISSLTGGADTSTVANRNLPKLLATSKTEDTVAKNKPGASRIADIAPDVIFWDSNLVKKVVTPGVPYIDGVLSKNYGKYRNSALPPVKLKFVSDADLAKIIPAGVNPGDVFAFSDPKSNAIYVNPNSQIINNPPLSPPEMKRFITVEMLHMRGAGFEEGIRKTYSPSDGQPTKFSDGSDVSSINDGLAHLFAMESLSMKSAPSFAVGGVNRAASLTKSVGLETVKKAYFGNDPASLAKVKQWINQQVSDQKATRSSSSAR